MNSLLNRSDRKHFALAATVLFLVTLFAGVTGSLGTFTAWDDLETVASNPGIGHQATISDLSRFWTTAPGHIYIPMTYTFWWATGKLFGATSALPFKCLSLAVHFVAGLLVYGLARCVVKGEDERKSFGAAVLAGALFIAHPLQVESVAWVSGLKDVLSGAFVIGGLWTFVLGLQSGKRPWFVVSVVLMAFAMLSKPGAVWGVAAMGMLGVLLGRELWGRWCWPVMFAALLAVATIMVARLAQPVIPEAVPVHGLAKLWIAADALGWYIGKLLLPIQLCVEQGRSPGWLMQVATSADRFWTIGMLIAAVLALAWTQNRKIQAGALLAVAGVLPYLGLTSFDFQTYSTVAEHYAYGFMAGIAIVVGAIAARGGVWTFRTLVVICIALVGLSVRQGMTWRDTETLFTRVIRVNPSSVAGHNNLASYYLKVQDIPRALDASAKAIHLGESAGPRVLPSLMSICYYNRGRALESSGDKEQAMTMLIKAVEVDRGQGAGWQRLGEIRAAQGDAAGAAEAYRRAAMAGQKAKAAVASTELDAGRFAEAEKWARWALEEDPANRSAGGNLAAALLGQGKLGEAAEIARRFPTSPAAQNVLGVVAAQAGDNAQAEAYIRQAIAGRPDVGAYHFNLATVLIRAGKTGEAIASLERARDLGYARAESRLRELKGK